MKKSRFLNIIILIFLAYSLNLFGYNKANFVAFRNLQNGTIFDNIKNNGNVFFYSQEADTSTNGNKISKIWNDNQNFRIKLYITQYKDQSIRLSLYNLLGKEVKVIYEGVPLDNDYEYTFPYLDLPNGVYLCVLNGHFYRDTKKIVISK
ncbi:MAG: hypothetical protein ACPL1A_02130 [Candidatus Kapaibacteriota bacterium]